MNPLQKIAKELADKYRVTTPTERFYTLDELVGDGEGKEPRWLHWGYRSTTHPDKYITYCGKVLDWLASRPSGNPVTKCVTCYKIASMR